MHRLSKTFGPFSVLLAICLFGLPAQAEHGGGSGTMAPAETSTYVFLSDQSTVVQTGGIAGVHETYPIEGQFRLSVDFDAGTASFSQVDANLLDESPFLPTQSLGELFNMAELVGTIVGDTTIDFAGRTADGTNTDILLRLTFTDDLVHLTGKTIPPPNSADFFYFNLDAVALKKYGGGWTYDGGILVGVYYYPWYGPTAHPVSQSLRRHLVPQQTAELGEYDSSSPAVIAKHIDYSRRANIHFWACSWWGPGNYTDNILKNRILPHRYAGELRYAILYESTGRLGSFSNPDYSNLVPDFQYFADNYFSNPNYLKIDGRPVVFIYLTRVYFRKTLGHNALDALRAAFPNLYIVADDIFGRNYSPAFASRWDAVTAYDVYGQTLQAHGSTRAALDQLKSILSKAKTAANSVGVGLIPFATPGFNDKGVREGHNGAPRYFENDPTSVEGNLFRAMLREVVVPKVDPLAENILMVTSFNEWHEDTQIEPTAGTAGTTNVDDSHSGSDYTQGDHYTDYGYLYLDILREETCFLEIDSLSEALDTALSFTTGGSANWFSQTTTSYYDGDAAQSGNISEEQDSWMQTTVSGMGTANFYWKVSSEDNFDFLEFYIDGSLQDQISGSVNWQQKTYTITTSGSHAFKWRYVKDDSVDSDSDCGWVDKVEWVTNQLAGVGN
jgi:glycoprotein endo-alpha-1,2-mannosidase